MRIALVTTLVVLFSARADARPAGEERWILYGVTGGAGRTIGESDGGAMSHGGFRWRASRSLWVDVHAGEGWFTPTEQLAGRLGAGVRWESQSEIVRPSLYAGFAHAHETTVERAMARPGPSLFATDTEMQHRTGVELGVGLASPPLPLHPRAKWSLVLLARTSVTYYGDTLDRPLCVLGDVGVGVAF